MIAGRISHTAVRTTAAACTAMAVRKTEMRALPIDCKIILKAMQEVVLPAPMIYVLEEIGLSIESPHSSTNVEPTGVTEHLSFL